MQRKQRAMTENADLTINQPDVALIFEGGGMRNSYTAGMVVELLDRNLNFGKVYGISAGSSHTVNYLVRDPERARASFVELVQYPALRRLGQLFARHRLFQRALSLRGAHRDGAQGRPHELRLGHLPRQHPPICTSRLWTGTPARPSPGPRPT